MNLFKKIFGRKKSEPSKDVRSKFMPEKQLPIDERFVINFNKNGGKFIYCESEDEIQKAFAQIICENGEHFRILYPNESLTERFNKYKEYYTTSFNQANAYITECENLIADNGSILFTSRQIGEKKVKDLPKTLIVCATTSQMVNDLADALKSIRIKNKNEPPRYNISAFQNFKESEEEDDFRTYGSRSKNTYLLLLEDLEN